MTGAELIKWIQDNHAEDMDIKVKTGHLTDDQCYYLFDVLKPDDICIIDNNVVYL